MLTQIRQVYLSVRPIFGRDTLSCDWISDGKDDRSPNSMVRWPWPPYIGLRNGVALEISDRNVRTRFIWTILHVKRVPDFIRVICGSESRNDTLGSSKWGVFFIKRGIFCSGLQLFRKVSLCCQIVGFFRYLRKP